MQRHELQRAEGAAADGGEQQQNAGAALELGPVCRQMRQCKRQHDEHDQKPARHGQAGRRHMAARRPRDHVIAGPAGGRQGQEDVSRGL